MKNAGTYALVIDLGADLSLPIGKLGVRSFPAGYYVYVGSALSGLSGRLRHHLGSAKKSHWHIDYLLENATIGQIWCVLGKDRLECKWNDILQGLPGATPSTPSFGASDCRCLSHLTYFQKMPPFDIFVQRLQQEELPPAQHLIVK